MKILGDPIPILDDKFDWEADVFNFKFEIGLSPELQIDFNFKKSGKRIITGADQN